MQTIRHFVFSVVLTFSFLPAFCQNSILWEVSGNGLDHPSYLLGSLKFIGEKEYFLPKEIVDRIKTSQLFAIEDEVNHHAQHELNKAIHFPKGKSLASVLSPEDYNKVENFFLKEFKISQKKFKKNYATLKPLALSIAMTRLSLNEGVKFYDIELLKMANSLRIATFSLEPIEREAQAFNAFAVEDQAKALLHSIDNFETQKMEFKNLEAAYTEGDINRVFEYSLHPFENNQNFIEEFYYKRNEEWLPKIEKMFAEQKSFVTVGVTHLKGEKGLLNLLKSKGYILTPIAVTQ